MAEWDDRLSGAAAWANLTQVRELLAEGPATPGATQRAWRDRVSWLTNHLAAYREVDAQQVTASMIQTLDASAAQLASHLDTWATSGSEQYLSIAAGQDVDAVLDALRGWPYLTRDRSHRATIDAAQEYKAVAESAVQALEDAVATAQQGTSTAEEEAIRIQQAAEEGLAALRREILSLEDTIAGEKQRISTALDTSDEKFSSTEEHRETIFQQAADDLDAKVRAALVKIDSDADAAAAAVRSDAESTLDQLRSLDRQATELVGVISVKGTATGYGRYANQQRTAAWIWAVAAVVLGLGGFAVILWTLGGVEASTSWREIVTKIAASLTLGGIATYCGNQSGQHREQERTAKRMELDIAALNPFINNLKQEDQDKIRAGVADRMFLPTSTPTVPAKNNAEVSSQDAEHVGGGALTDLSAIGAHVVALTQGYQKAAK